MCARIRVGKTGFLKFSPGIFLKFDPGLSQNTLLGVVLHTFHLSYKVGYFHERAGNSSPGKNNVLRGSSFLEGFDYFRSFKKFVAKSDMNFIENNQIIFRILQEPATLFPGFPDSFSIFLA